MRRNKWRHFIQNKDYWLITILLFIIYLFKNLLIQHPFRYEGTKKEDENEETKEKLMITKK